MLIDTLCLDVRHVFYWPKLLKGRVKGDNLFWSGGVAAHSRPFLAPSLLIITFHWTFFGMSLNLCTNYKCYQTLNAIQNFFCFSSIFNVCVVLWILYLIIIFSNIQIPILNTVLILWVFKCLFRILGILPASLQRVIAFMIMIKVHGKPQMFKLIIKHLHSPPEM